MPYNLVGFTGRKRSGKDTAAQVLVDAGAFHLKFADPLKAMLMELMRLQGAPQEIIRRCIDGDLKEEPCRYLNGRTPRHAMQHLGTTWGRNFMGTDFWVNIIGNIVQGAPTATFVCSDVRFPNEVALIQKLGGVVYRIEREGVDKSDTHESEALIDKLKVDGVIENKAICAKSFQWQIAQMFLGPVDHQQTV